MAASPPVLRSEETPVSSECSKASAAPNAGKLPYRLLLRLREEVAPAPLGSSERRVEGLGGAGEVDGAEAEGTAAGPEVEVVAAAGLR